MMRFSSLFAMVCLVALPVLGADPLEGTGDQEDPHRALREAVEKIRIHYAPGVGSSSDFLMQARLGRPVLGIIIRGRWLPAEGEAEPGAEILAVTPGSPADEAGLQPGDVVVAWNGEPLVRPGGDPQQAAEEASDALAARSRQLDEGDSVTLRYRRDGRELESTLVAREVRFELPTLKAVDVDPDFDFQVAPNVSWRASGPWFLPRGWLDMELVAINPELGEYFGTDTGVLVVRGPAEDEVLGLASGDVILRIGDREVKSPEHAMRILRSYDPDEELTVDIIRHGRSQTLTGTVPESSFNFHYRFRTPEADEPT